MVNSIEKGRYDPSLPLAFAIGAVYGMPATLVGPAVLWVGMIAGLVSVVIRTRRA